MNGVAGLREKARHLLAGAMLAIGLVTAATVAAQPAPDAVSSDPILRIEATAHTAMIRRIATDRENRYAVTVSDDKTARLWSLTDNRLMSVLRVPIGDGNMGKLSAVAMTPDGGTVALGGWTGPTGEDMPIYIFIAPREGCGSAFPAFLM